MARGKIPFIPVADCDLGVSRILFLVDLLDCSSAIATQTECENSAEHIKQESAPLQTFQPNTSPHEPFPHYGHTCCQVAISVREGAIF